MAFQNAKLRQQQQNVESQRSQFLEKQGGLFNFTGAMMKHGKS